jgi:hypothetical protein
MDASMDPKLFRLEDLYIGFASFHQPGCCVTVAKLWIKQADEFENRSTDH